MGAIQLLTEVPGPKSRQLLARRAAATPSGLACSTDVVIDRARGALVQDIDGNTLLDFCSGIGMLNAGHNPPEVVAAVTRQAERYLHVCALVGSYEPYVALAEALNDLAPGAAPKKTLLANTGSEAVENAIKLARAYTGRPAVLCFEAAYHGRSIFTLSLTSKYSLFKKGFGPFASEVYRVPAPYPYRRPEGLSEQAYVDWCCSQLENAFTVQVAPEAVAAIIIEPVQGEGGFLPMPAAFLRKIRQLCDEHGIIFIADEIQSGCGRTGKMWAIDHSGVVPDVITCAKSLGSGLPISATTGRADIMDSAHPGGLGGTYSGSPLACVAALESLALLRKPEALERAREVGESMASELERWAQDLALVGDARGVGAMRAIELVSDRKQRTPAPEQTLRIVQRAGAAGLMLIRAGIYSNCIRLLPPLTITDAQLQEGLGVLREAIAAED